MPILTPHHAGKARLVAEKEDVAVAAGIGTVTTFGGMNGVLGLWYGAAVPLSESAPPLLLLLHLMNIFYCYLLSLLLWFLLETLLALLLENVRGRCMYELDALLAHVRRTRQLCEIYLDYAASAKFRIYMDLSNI